MNKSNSKSLDDFNQQEIENHIFIIVILFIIMIMAIIGNSLVVYIHLRKLNRTASTVLVIYLGWSQLIKSAIAIPIDVTFLFLPYKFPNDLLCRFMQSVVFMSDLVSGLIIFTISIDRFKKVCRPFSAQFTRKGIKKIISLNIAATTLPVSVNFYIRGIKKIPLGDKLIGHMCSISDKAVPLVVYCFFLFMLVLCAVSVVTFVIIYSTIFVKLREYSRRKRRVMATHQPSTSKISERTSSRDDVSESVRSRDLVFRPMQRKKYYIATTRITLNMSFITLAWSLTYIPYFTINFLNTKINVIKTGWKPPDNIFYRMSTYSYHLNDLIIPIIYVIFNPAFRREVKNLFKRYILCSICNKSNEN